VSQCYYKDLNRYGGSPVAHHVVSLQRPRSDDDVVVVDWRGRRQTSVIRHKHDDISSSLLPLCCSICRTFKQYVHHRRNLFNIKCTYSSHIQRCAMTVRTRQIRDGCSSGSRSPYAPSHWCLCKEPPLVFPGPCYQSNTTVIYPTTNTTDCLDEPQML